MRDLFTPKQGETWLYKKYKKMNQKTALEWFLEQLLISNVISLTKEQAEENMIGLLFLKAKEMEREQRGYTKEDVLKAGEIGE